MSFTIIPVCMMANDHLLSGNSYYIQKSYCIRGKSIFSGWENVFKNLWLHHNVHTYMDQLGTVPYCPYSMWKSMCSCQVNVNFCPPSYFHASGQSHVTWNPKSNSFTSQRKLIGLKFPPHIWVSLHGKIVWRKTAIDFWKCSRKWLHFNCHIWIKVQIRTSLSGNISGQCFSNWLVRVSPSDQFILHSISPTQSYWKCL